MSSRRIEEYLERYLGACRSRFTSVNTLIFEPNPPVVLNDPAQSKTESTWSSEVGANISGGQVNVISIRQ
jgi:hypothetical protein